MNNRGILSAYVGRDVDLIIDLGDTSLSGGQHPIKVRGNLVQALSEEINSYTVLISDWDASVSFVVNQAIVKLVLDGYGEPEDITITVLPREMF